MRGDRLILGLFVVLAASAALCLALFAWTPYATPYRTIVWRALAGNLALPVVAWFILKGIAAQGRLRAAWWASAPFAAVAAYLIVMSVIVLLSKL